MRSHTRSTRPGQLPGRGERVNLKPAAKRLLLAVRVRIERTGVVHLHSVRQIGDAN